MEINWGEPVILVVSPDGDTKKINTPEQAAFWLRKKWPISDDHKYRAMDYIDAALNCLVEGGTARLAFIKAAKTAGFVPNNSPSNTVVPA